LFKGCPFGARRVVLLNKADLLVDAAAALSLGRMILFGAAGRVERVLLGSLVKKEFVVLKV
jgi:hypothetical protein